MSYPEGYELFLKSNHLLNDLKAPQVAIHSLYGIGVKTPESFEYDGSIDWYNKQPTTIYGDGDGTVNKKSLLGFERWHLQQNETIHSYELHGIDHLETLKHSDTINYILNLLYL